MLYFTPFSFGIAASLLKNRTWIKPILVCLMGTSILYHGKKHDRYKGKKVVAALDKALVTGIIVGSAVEMAKCPKGAPTVVWVSCFSWVTYVYKIARLSFRSGIKGEMWHASNHFACCIGLVALRIAQHSKKAPLEISI
jgi:predicted membrane channel-forming protein YqfA (hemolysin III family)